MSDWTDLDLPLPEVPAYGYSVDAGLQRTPFTTAKPRQRRKYETNRRNFAVEVLLTQVQLATAESFIQCYGYTWFTMPLLSGQDEVDVVSDHSVRLTENYQISAVGWNLYKLSMQLEDRFVEPACRWCGVDASWDVAESAWDTLGPVEAEVVAIQPIAVSGVEWWKNPRPTTIMIMFKYALDQVCTKLIFEIETLISPFPSGSVAAASYFDLVPPSIDMTPVSNTGFTADLSGWLGGDIFANFAVDFNGGTWEPAVGEGFRATLTAYDQNDSVMWDHSEELYTNFPGAPPEPVSGTGGYLSLGADCSGADFGGGY